MATEDWREATVAPVDERQRVWALKAKGRLARFDVGEIARLREEKIKRLDTERERYILYCHKQWCANGGAYQSTAVEVNKSRSRSS